MISNLWLMGAGVVWAMCPAGELGRFEAAQLHMGTKFIIVLYAPDEPTANRGFAAAFARIAALDACLSDYHAESELGRLSAASPTPEPVQASDDVIAVLARAQQISTESDGAFDVTVGPLTKLWRRARRLEQLPSPERMQEALAAVGYQSLVVDAKAHTVHLLKPHMRLDVGGIAKGYAVDQALIELDRLGITHALVNASGDLAASGPPPGKQGWTVGIAPLSPAAPPSVFGALAHQAIATSGDAFQYVEIDHVRYSHIINPHTGLGLTQRSSVSVLARNCTDADALASATSVLGPEAGLRWIEQRPDTEALVVFEQDGQTVTRQTSGFAAWVTAGPDHAQPGSGATRGEHDDEP
ncbi:MAG: FAD:protein FMN transferase [Pirellulaceae bacterium]|nr:FAD:protein FMN transferase [Pirellulaceae bacterium]